ncbi:MAG TPA: dihydropyrimidine dehydrogenase subunit A, partial [Deltaproteobacteria bacterium]|nr:dihydropyrimidine dehydrogenase subunit A [Deltaproteobacteria bacterium]
MDQILFSSWQGEVVDNRGKQQDQPQTPKRFKVPDEFAGQKMKAFMGWDGFALFDSDVDIVAMCVRYVEAV